MGRVKVEIATTLTPAIVDAVERLVGQLSRSAAPPTVAELGDIVSSPATDLFIAIDDGGEVVGTATLVTFRIPTGMRAWIEDVVVDEAGPGGAPINRSDLAIEADVRGAIVERDDLSLSAKDVRISATNGLVVIEGAVESEVERALIDELARSTSGVRAVDNRLTVVTH